MPRRRRGLVDHSCCHVTHRCHKREFLFRFARDRQAYVDLMRETVNRFRIDVLNCRFRREWTPITTKVDSAGAQRRLYHSTDVSVQHAGVSEGCSGCLSGAQRRSPFSPCLCRSFRTVQAGSAGLPVRLPEEVPDQP